MPERAARVVDVRTSPVAERIAAIDDFVGAGYDVHVNFSPVIVYDGWETDHVALVRQPGPDALLCGETAAQGGSHFSHPQCRAARGEPALAPQRLWRPELQQKKLSQNGMWNLRYKAPDKRR